MTDIYTSDKKSTTKTQIQSDTKSPREWWKVVVDDVLQRVNLEPQSSKMGSFCVRPGHRFLTQQDDEEIVLLLRAHPITNIGWMLLVLLMLLAPTLVMQLGVLNQLPAGFLFIGKMTWYLVTLMYAFEKFLYWYYSVFIVTNERLVDIDFDNLTYRQITYANLNHIEEPEMITGGFVRSIFQYGDLHVTTASENPSLEALGIPWPQKAVDIISRLAEELEKRRERGE